MHKREDNYRPWGFYEILSVCDDHKVKRITVYPGKRCSLQRHKKRSEHWYILKGEGCVVLKNEKINVDKGKTVDIDFYDIHRIENTGKDELVLIEVQCGEYFGEDDIERLEDDFGRG
ncbi:MAG: phosphomannose isomerase type II C-terminal cupin domain [Spirochaetes bacterium]|jgi:mannose-6-phosphate isomerase-like protein (cupin superfamily)|nr:phosphomannose isomerase type II C-terminal cupin domain [Spirochaetota bacterium]